MTKTATIHDVRFEALLKQLKNARLAKGLTQEQLAAKVDQYRIYINKIESGQRRIDVAELFDLCKALDLSIYDLIQSTFENKPNAIQESNSDYILGFSNGYLQGRGFEGDPSVSARIISKE